MPETGIERELNQDTKSLKILEDLEDSQLIELILKEKKTDLFEIIVKRYQRQILVYCLRLLNFHQQDAEDVVSQTFYKTYLNLASFRPKLKFSSWIYRIAHNEAINLIKKKTKNLTFDLSDFQFLPIIENQGDDLIKRDDLEMVLNQLKVTDRNLLILFHLEEKSLKEISNILKLAPNTIAVKLRRARTRAKKIIQTQYKN